jgi:hypothetical protein
LLTLLAFAALPLIAVGGLLWLHGANPLFGPAATSSAQHVERPGEASPPSRSEHEESTVGPSPVVSPLVDGLLAALALSIGIGALALVLWVRFGAALQGRWLGKDEEGEVRRLAEVVEDSLDDFQLEPDPRLAIIRCYQRFEQALASAGYPRRDWETPTEFMRSALRAMRLPESAVLDLTRLFELSRFSHHAIGEPQRDAARRHLTAIDAALARRGLDVQA